MLAYDETCISVATHMMLLCPERLLTKHCVLAWSADSPYKAPELELRMPRMPPAVRPKQA